MTLRLWILMLAAAASLGAQAQSNPPGVQIDGRFNLRFTAAEQSEFLAEMRVMLGTVQGIVQGIAASDRDAIARFARLSGNRMSRATPAAVRAKLPKAFEELGGPTHLMFEELAIRAETDDMDQIGRQLATTMGQCMACHTTFKVR
jgi:cytochrome c556